MSGVNPLREWFEKVPARVLIDTDPGFTQVRHLTEAAARERAVRHNAFFSFGENIGRAGCRVPDDGLPWRPTRQPVALAAWPVTAAPGDGRYTTVMQWESYPARCYGALRLAMKSESFAPFAELPRRLGRVLEIALGGPNAPRAALAELGWRIADAVAVSEDPWTYHRFIQASKGEFGVAKQGYVATRCGWFSERSAVYLASGRPVLAQDTGFADWLPCGAGVLAFASPEEVIDGVARIEADYERHRRAARDLAEAYFAAPRVLPPLLEAALSGSRRTALEPVG